MPLRQQVRFFRERGRQIAEKWSDELSRGQRNASALFSPTRWLLSGKPVPILQNALSGLDNIAPSLGGYCVITHIRRFGTLSKDRDGIRAVLIHDFAGYLLDQLFVIFHTWKTSVRMTRSDQRITRSAQLAGPHQSIVLLLAAVLGQKDLGAALAFLL
jgi:hypothetical protein